MKLWLTWIAIALATIIGGCVDDQPWQWAYAPLPGDHRDLSKIDEDFRACIRQFDSAALSLFDVGHAYPTPGHDGKSEVQKCMERKGWSKAVRPWFP